MTKKEALQKFFAANPAYVKLLELQRDGCTSAEKADERGCKKRTVKNQQGTIIKVFGVCTMDQAVHHAMYYGIVAPKRHRRRPAPRRVRITPLWSEELKHYHRKYIVTLVRAKRLEIGVDPVE